MEIPAENESNKIPHVGPHVFEELNIGPIKYVHPQIISEQAALNPSEIENGLGESNPVKETEKVKDISYFKLFRFATNTDILLMVLGALAACINGITIPLFSLIFG